MIERESIFVRVNGQRRTRRKAYYGRRNDKRERAHTERKHIVTEAVAERKEADSDDLDSSTEAKLRVDRDEDK
jgi:hypothetical protein